jgi:hypothetical protein
VCQKHGESVWIGCFSPRARILFGDADRQHACSLLRAANASQTWSLNVIREGIMSHTFLENQDAREHFLWTDPRDFLPDVQDGLTHRE